MFTYEINRLLDRDAHASADHRFSYQFSWNLLNDGQDQGDFVDQGLYLSERYGIMTEQDYGISGTYQFKWATGYDKYYKALQYRTQEVLTFADSIPLMKRWLYDAGDGSAVGGVLTFSAMSRGWEIDDDYQGPSLLAQRPCHRRGTRPHHSRIRRHGRLHRRAGDTAHRSLHRGQLLGHP